MSNHSNEWHVLSAIFASAVIITSTFLYIFVMAKHVTPLFHMYIVTPNQNLPIQHLNITTNVDYTLIIGSQNLMGSIEYCQVQVKLGNMSDTLPNGTLQSQDKNPCLLPPLISFHFFLLHNETWSKSLQFKLFGERSDSTFTITSLELNNMTFEMHKPVVWDEEMGGFYYQLLFELWLLNEETMILEYSGVWVSILFSLKS